MTTRKTSTMTQANPEKKFSTISISQSIALAFIAVCVYVVMCCPQPELDWDNDILPKIQTYMETMNIMTNNDQPNQLPLNGLVIAVTGATSGIGLGLSRTLAAKGATILAIGRSARKLQELQEEFKNLGEDSSTARIQPIVVDLSDLDSVANGSQYILDKYSRLDFLVNNAGIHTKVEGIFLPPQTTKQGFDLTFGVNYLSHFLLTEKLFPLLQKSPSSKVIQISSTFHWAVDGSDLMTFLSTDKEDNGTNRTDSSESSLAPVASSAGGSHGFVFFRSQRQYANSKLAQVLHARALQRRVSSSARSSGDNGNSTTVAKNASNDTTEQSTRSLNNCNVSIVSVCPGWVSTQIVAKSGTWTSHYVGAIAFQSHGVGLRAILHAMFDRVTTGIPDDVKTMSEKGVVEEEDGGVIWTDNKDFYANTDFSVPNIMDYMPSWMYAMIPIRDIYGFLHLFAMLYFQRFLPPKSANRKSSRVSYDIELQDNLYDWSLGAVENWL